MKYLLSLLAITPCLICAKEKDPFLERDYERAIEVYSTRFKQDLESNQEPWKQMYDLLGMYAAYKGYIEQVVFVEVLHSMQHVNDIEQLISELQDAPFRDEIRDVLFRMAASVN